MGEYGKLFFFGKCHQPAGNRAIGIAAVVQMEFANALVRATRGTACIFGQHHVVDGVVAVPVVVVRTVAVQADKRHHGHTRGVGLRTGFDQGLGAVVGPRIGDDGFHAVALHTRQHIRYRMRALRRLHVVVQVGIEQRAGVVGGTGGGGEQGSRCGSAPVF